MWEEKEIRIVWYQIDCEDIIARFCTKQSMMDFRRSDTGNCSAHAQQERTGRHWKRPVTVQCGTVDALRDGGSDPEERSYVASGQACNGIGMEGTLTDCLR